MNFCINSISLSRFFFEFRGVAKRFQMHPNGKKRTKHEFSAQWHGSGAFVAKNSNKTSWHELLH